MAPNYHRDLLVITSASGKQVSHLLDHLIHKWTNIRLVVHSSASQRRLQADYPSIEVLTADLTHPTECNYVLTDATVLYHIGPSFHAHELGIGYNMIDAAGYHSKNSDTFKHFVYSSVLHSQLRKLMNHDCKRYVEEYLIESGLDYTILQPSHFMDNFAIGKLVQQKIEGKTEIEYPIRWDPEVEFSFASLEDLALAAMTVMDERERHFAAKYEICSTRAMSYIQVCDVVGEVMGCKVVAKKVPFQEAVDDFLPAIVGDKAGERERDGVERLLLYYNRRGLVGNPNILEWLIGRKPLSFKDWAKQQVKAAN